MKKLLIFIYLCICLTFAWTAIAYPPIPMYHWNTSRDTDVLVMTNGETQTVITENQLANSGWLSIQGASAETDIQLVAVSYYSLVRVINDEAQVIELCPPTGEIMYLDGVAMDANDCVDSDGVVGSAASLFRFQDASGTWHWHLLSITGLWSDTGATD